MPKVHLSADGDSKNQTEEKTPKSADLNHAKKITSVPPNGLHNIKLSHMCVCAHIE